jgi:Bacterial Ig-like domain (group 3)/FG-GAP-like repeat
MAVSLRADCPSGLLPPSHYDANVRPGDVATGDFNKDGYVDLAVVNRQTSTISILLGTSGGGFLPPSQIALDSYTQDDIQVADFNNDGNLDLVVAVSGTVDLMPGPHLEVFLGNGDGTFVPVPYTAQQLVFQNPSRMVLGDFDRDGLIDVATTKGNGQFSSMKNIGNGVLTEKAVYTTTEITGYASGIAAGDFDGDGNLDIAVSEMTSNKIFLFYGLGDGTFTKSAYTIDLTDPTTGPQDVQAGDFNGDGKDDLAIVSVSGSGNTLPPLKIALSNGAARTFATPVDYGHLQDGMEALIKDIDGDGKLDVLVAEFRGVSIFHGNGDGTFGAQQTIGTFDLGLAVDDFDRDGGPDIVGTDFVSGKVDIYLNTCGQIALNLTSSANPVVAGTAVTVTGTVVSPPAAAATGTLTLKQGTTVLTSINLNGGNTLAATINGLTPATYSITAEYSGDSRFQSAIKSIQQIVTVPPFGPPPGLNAISFGGPVQISWFATSNTDHYEVWRNTGAGSALLGTAAIAAFTDSTAPQSSAILYRVRAIAAGGDASKFSAPDLALTYAFTDGTLQAGVTPVKQMHLLELRDAANKVRALGGLSTVIWTDQTPQLIRAQHVVELRGAINQARAALGLPTLAFTDSTLTAGSSAIRAIHFEELRAAMR